MMKRAIVLLLACGKHDDPPPEPAPAVVKAAPVDAAEVRAKCATPTGMPVDHYKTVSSQVTPSETAFPRRKHGLVIDMAACKYARQDESLAMGSIWVLVHPLDDKRCEVWMGGETENPHYDGKPSGYCVFERAGVLEIPLDGAGGPPSVKCCP
jgi:hypothetical protein